MYIIIHSHLQSNLKDYDREILQELWKIRSTVHEIQDSQSIARKEQKYLDDSYLDRSLSPSLTLPRCALSPDRSPSPDTFLTVDGERYRSGTLQLLSTAPTHLKKESDEKVLEEFFGSENITKLNDFKIILTSDDGNEETDTPTLEKLLQNNETSEVPLRKKLKIPTNPNSSVNRNRMSYDVASEMEQLRMRIHENARQELEELDKKFSPKTSHPGFGLIDSASHSRHSSLDSSTPAISAPSSAPGTTTHSRQNSLPAFEASPAPLRQVKSSSTSPQVLYKDGSLESPTSRSPTPPQQYLHIHQVSAGSNSSMGSGTLSPPLQITAPLHQTNILSMHKPPYSASSTSHSPQHNPQFHNIREPLRVARPQSGRLPQAYDRGIISHSHSNSMGGLSTSQSTGQQISTNLESKRFSGSSTNIHYSSAAHNRGSKRNSLELEDNSKSNPSPPPHSQNYYNGYPPSKPPLCLPNKVYYQTNRHSSGDLDQPEIKSIPRAMQLRRAPSGEKVAASPRMGRQPVPSSLVPGPSVPVNTHQRLGPRLNDWTKYSGGNSSQFQNKNNAQVHPEDIEPYMTSKDVKNNFKYTPFADTSASREKPRLQEANVRLEKPAALHSNDQTWC